VTLLGRVSGEAKEKFLANITVLSLPSYAENSPASLLEAMAYGRPVIATRVGGVPDMVKPGVNGWLVEAGAVSQLTEALVAASTLAPEELTALGQNAFQTVITSHTWEAAGANVVRLYKTLAASR